VVATGSSLAITISCGLTTQPITFGYDADPNKPASPHRRRHHGDQRSRGHVRPPVGLSPQRPTAPRGTPCATAGSSRRGTRRGS
jgi:hypothetical protein